MLPLTKRFFTIILSFLLFNSLNAQTNRVADHDHSDGACKDICYIQPDSIVKLNVYLPFATEKTAQHLGIRDGLVYYQGDVILGRYNEVATTGRGLGTNGAKWTNSTVRYYINGGFSTAQVNQIVSAANTVASKTDVCFERIYSPSGNYVNVVTGAGCSSYVGMTGGGQALTLASNCGLAATKHEFLHAAGMWHEQSRYDRNSHIVIYYNNITSGLEYNFNTQSNASNYGAYDVNSIMHYNSYAFSKNGQPTILKLNGGTIPYINYMSSGDVATINAMYSTCGGGGGGGNTCSAPSTAQNTTTNIAQTTARLNCSANYTYRQWRYRNSNTSSWTTLNYTTNISYVNVAGLAASSTYYWQSRVWCGNVWSGWSANESFTTSGGSSCSAPSSAQNSTSSITASSATLNCSANYVYRQFRYRSSSTSTWTTLSYTTNQSAQSVSGLSSSTTYYWQSRVWCGNVWSGWSANESFSTTGGGGGGGGGACSAASGLYSYGITSYSCVLDWNNTTNATIYYVYYWNGSSWTYFASSGSSNINVNSLQPSSTYYFLVGAYCGSTFGGYSNYVTVTTASGFTGTTTQTQMAATGIDMELPHESFDIASFDVTDAGIYFEVPDVIPGQGIELDIDAELAVRLAPNPVSSAQAFTINVQAESKDVRLMVTDINGNQLFVNQYELEPGTNNIELMPIGGTGVYFITIQTKDQVITRKLMVLD